MAEIITTEQWMAELEQLQESSPDGMSGREISEALGVSRDVVRRFLRKGIDAGRMVCTGRRAGTRIDGIVMRNVPVYRLTSGGADE